jgi:hypothetical protein
MAKVYKPHNEISGIAGIVITGVALIKSPLIEELTPIILFHPTGTGADVLPSG